MRYRKLRIAWSALWGLAAAVLIVVWVRGYWIEDFCEWSSQTRNYGVFSDNGRFSLQRAEFVAGRFDFHYGEVSARDGMNFSPGNRSTLGVSLNVWNAGWFASVSYAWVLPIIGITAVVPWFPWSGRFSLRILLVATTLVAVVLGLIVWLRSDSG